MRMRERQWKRKQTEEKGEPPRQTEERRNFMIALPLLPFLYVSSVQVSTSGSVPRSTPAVPVR